MALHDVPTHVRTQGEGPASVERRTKPRTGLRLATLKIIPLLPRWQRRDMSFPDDLFVRL
jgi:hypothetical protein